MPLPPSFQHAPIVKLVRHRLATLPPHTELTLAETVDMLAKFNNTNCLGKLARATLELYATQKTFDWFAMFVADQRGNKEQKPWH